MLARAAPFRRLGTRSIFTLPDLPYDYNALEPVISADIMKVHHQKHHAAYVNNLNLALEKFDMAKAKIDLPTQVALQSQIKFNGGGNINHTIFWKNLCPVKDAKGEPTGKWPATMAQPGFLLPLVGKLAEAIKDEFGSFDRFKSNFNANTGAIQGSGWGWLVWIDVVAVAVFYQCLFRDLTRSLGSFDSPLLLTKTRCGLLSAWFRFSAWMFGSMPTTCSTRTPGQTILRRFGKL
jgi:superoxide dismutase